MIDLTDDRLLRGTVQTSVDPGVLWVKDAAPAIEVPPDGETAPGPEVRWPTEAVRTGVYGAVSPRVVRRAGGTYRMYYTQIVPRRGFPAGANDYENASARVLSAVSEDGVKWKPEAGVRLTPAEGGAGEFRVASSEVVPALGNSSDGSGQRLRMYFECCPGLQSQPNSIRSAVSKDGLKWEVESGERVSAPGKNFMGPRIVFLPPPVGGVRMYVCESGVGIVSAVSKDGVKFEMEPGVRVAQDTDLDRTAAFAPEILQLEGGGYVMYYAAYSTARRAAILRATSEDGLLWRKDGRVVVGPGGRWDRVKCSEMCVYRLPARAGERARYGMVYEACDGTTVNDRGVWRIAGAGSS